MQFSNLQLNKSILKSLTENKHHTATLVQQKVIPVVLGKKDVIVTGQDIVTAGIGGALFSGVLSTLAVTGKNVLKKI